MIVVGKLRHLFCRKNTSCLVCGEKISLLGHMLIGRHVGVECSRCHSYMIFDDYVFVLKKILLILAIPFALIFPRSYFWGGLGVLLVLFCLFMVSYTAKYHIDPAHSHRIKGVGDN